MTKRELANALAEKNNLTQKDAANIVNSVVDIITESLANGDTIQLTGFGSFGVKERAERQGHNPRERDSTITIPARKSPYFKAGKALKDSVNK